MRTRDRHRLQWVEVKEIGRGRTIVHKPVFILHYRAHSGTWGSQVWKILQSADNLILLQLLGNPSLRYCQCPLAHVMETCAEDLRYWSWCWLHEYQENLTRLLYFNSCFELSYEICLMLSFPPNIFLFLVAPPVLHAGCSSCLNFSRQ